MSFGDARLFHVLSFFQPQDFSFDELDQVKEHYPQGHHGVDREGCPVYIELIGKVDAHKVLKHTTMERYLKYHVKEFERMFSTKFPAASIACGRHIEQSTSIMDADGVVGYLSVWGLFMSVGTEGGLCILALTRNQK